MPMCGSKMVTGIVGCRMMDCFCRYDSHSGGEKEIQRTMLELLNQLDGFDSRQDVKVCMYNVHRLLFS